MNNTVKETKCLIVTGWSYNSLVGKHNAAVRSIHDINENRSQLRVQRDNLQEENARLKTARDADKGKIKKLQAALKQETEENNARRVSIENLEKKLEKAQRNDMPQDPKTGKFVSKKKAPAKKAVKKTTKKKK